MRKHPILVALFVFLVLLAVGAVSQEAYRKLSTAPSVIRGGDLDGADSTDWTAPITASGTNKTVYETHGNTTVICSPRLSVSGATSTIRVGLWHFDGALTWTFLGIASISTATGGTTTDSAGDYVAESLIFADTGAATHYEPRITDPSDSSTIRLVTWGTGASSQQ